MSVHQQAEDEQGRAQGGQARNAQAEGGGQSQEVQIGTQPSSQQQSGHGQGQAQGGSQQPGQRQSTSVGMSRPGGASNTMRNSLTFAIPRSPC